MMQMLVYWHWLIAGVVLLIVEAFAPAAFFLWLGVAGLAVGLLLALVPGLSVAAQLTLFAVFSLLSIVGWRFYRKRRPQPSARPSLNKRARHYVGRVFVLEEPIVHGTGRLRVDDSLWKLHGSDCAAGQSVRVVETDGMVLQVEAVAATPEP